MDGRMNRRWIVKKAALWKGILYLSVAWGMTGAVILLAAKPGESLVWLGASIMAVCLMVAILAWLLERANRP